MVFDTVSDLLDPVLLPQEEVEKEKEKNLGRLTIHFTESR